MREKLVIVPKMKSIGKRVAVICIFAAACLCMLWAAFLAPLLMLPAFLLITLWVWLGFYSNIEYEYTYYDGELRFARIRNKSKRKNLAEVSMDDALILAPKGDRGVQKYENDKSLKYKNLTSGRPNAKIYELVAKTEEHMVRYEFEPDEEMLNAIMVKYARIVVK